MTAPPAHPVWCERAHGDMPLHSGQVGADLELSDDLAFAVYVSQRDGEAATVELMQHTPEETSFVRFSLLEAGILRDLVTEALSVVAEEVLR